jgi:hypothetical protein
MNIYTQEEVAKARHRDFVQAAEHARLVRQAQAARPGLLARVRRAIAERLVAQVPQMRTFVETHQE